eukprot:406261_1
MITNHWHSLLTSNNGPLSIDALHLFPLSSYTIRNPHFINPYESHQIWCKSPAQCMSNALVESLVMKRFLIYSVAANKSEFLKWMRSLLTTVYMSMDSNVTYSSIDPRINGILQCVEDFECNLSGMLDDFKDTSSELLHVFPVLTMCRIK